MADGYHFGLSNNTPKHLFYSSIVINCLFAIYFISPSNMNLKVKGNEREEDNCTLQLHGDGCVYTHEI